MAPRPSNEQLEALVDFLEHNPGIAKGLMRTSSGKAQTKKKWEEISRTLNSLGGVDKDGVGWSKYWSEKKSSLKKVCAKNNASIIGTGGGPPDSVELSDVDERMLAILGGQSFGTGDSGLAVNPFPASELLVTTGESFPAGLMLQNISTSPLSGLDNFIETSPRRPTERVANIVHRSPPRPAINVVRDRSPIRPAPPQRRPRGPVNSEGSLMNQMVDIEARRVDAETITARALESMARSLEAMAASINILARSLQAGFVSNSPVLGNHL